MGTTYPCSNCKDTTFFLHTIFFSFVVGAITLAFYAGNTEVYKVTQLRSEPSKNTTFGDLFAAEINGKIVFFCVILSLIRHHPCRFSCGRYHLTL